MLDTSRLSAEDAAIILELAPMLDIAVCKRLKKGSDRKFYIETPRGEKRVLCVKEVRDVKDFEWGTDFLRRYENSASDEIYMSRLVDRALYRDGSMEYLLMTWLDGEDLFDALPRMNAEERYATGIAAGKALHRLHQQPPPWENPEPWVTKYGKEVNGVIKKYGESVQTREGNLLAQYLTDNMGLLANRPRTFTHGDHNTLNIILSPDGRIGFIDFGQICRDPWWDFWELPSDVETQAHYYSGEFIGYFGGQPPLEFFKLLAFYVAVNALEQLAAHEGEDVPNHVKCVLNWFDDMRNPVPSWFLPFNQ